MKEYIAYEGERYIIEWYYTAKGESQPFRKQDKERAINARTDYIKRVKEGVYYED